MSDLLEQVLEAHGGLARWRQARTLIARMSLTGPLFDLKGQTGGLSNVTMEVNTRRPEVTVSPFRAPGQVGRFTADRTWIVDRNGQTLDERSNPRAAFHGHDRATPWDALHLLYFDSYAMWNYFVTPFCFTWPGVEVRELDPHDEDGRTWRRLAVTFPPDFPTHCPEQIFYYDERGRLQRMDYKVEVFQASAAHFCYDHQTFGGLLYPTLRRVVPRLNDRPHPSQPTTILVQVRDVLVL